MKTYLLAAALMAISLAGMAIGVILSNKALKGSCGGLGAIMGTDCDLCKNKDKCEKKKPKV